MHEIKEEIVILHFRIWLKVLISVGLILCIAVEYAIVRDLHGMRASPMDPFIGAFAVAGGIFAEIMVMLHKVRIDSTGVWGCIGIGVEPDRRGLFCRCVPWNLVVIRVYDFYFMPAASYDQRKLPILWSTFHTNWRKGMRLIAKYGMKSIDSEEDRKLIKKYAGIEQ